MSLCVCCGQTLEGAAALCLHHTLHERDWAASNRMMCDFIHRGIVVRREGDDVEAHDYALEELDAA